MEYLVITFNLSDLLLYPMRRVTEVFMVHGEYSEPVDQFFHRMIYFLPRFSKMKEEKNPVPFGRITYLTRD